MSCTIDGETAQKVTAVCANGLRVSSFGSASCVAFSFESLRTRTASHGSTRALAGFLAQHAIYSRCCQSADSLEETGAHFHAQAHISTQPPPPCKDTRLQGAHEDQGRRCRVEPPPCHWPQARCSQRRLPRLALPAVQSTFLPLPPPSGMRCLLRPRRVSRELVPATDHRI